MEFTQTNTYTITELEGSCRHAVKVFQKYLRILKVKFHQMAAFAIYLLFFKKNDFFCSNIGISYTVTYQLYQFKYSYRSFRICNYFLLKINISGTINIFVTLG